MPWKIINFGFGPANEVYAHSVDDQVPLDHLPEAVAWYAAFPERYLAAMGARSS